MSNALINRSEDLKRLRDEGYEVGIRHGYLLVSGIPYVNSNREVKSGILVSELTLAGERTDKPGTHVIHFCGEYPCNEEGTEIAALKYGSDDQKLADGVLINHSFSNKPAEGFSNYYEKIISYIRVISGPATFLDPEANPQTFQPVLADEEDSVFEYYDTNSSRAQIGVLSEKMKNERIGIIGLGGTGSYILDLMAKTPVAEIHLFDRDDFLQHNAFRSPGAAALSELEEKPKKVNYLKAVYAKMHKKIFPHAVHINSANVSLLEGLTFVFICMDSGPAKREIFDKLEAAGISFIDVGIGMEVIGEQMTAIVRTTTSTKNKRKHIHEKRLVSFKDPDPGDDYDTNIQIADLNALNAAFAVIKWKKLLGYYADEKREHSTTYTLEINMVVNDDHEV